MYLKIRILSILILLFYSVVGQPPLNQWDSFGRNVSLGGAIIPTDSCYYVLGSAYNDIVPNHLDAVFTKYDFNGNILDQNFVHIDSLAIWCYSEDNFIEITDNHFAALGNAESYPYFIEFDHKGDTVRTKLIEDLYLNDSLITTGPVTFSYNSIDSTFDCLAQAYHEISLSGVIVFFTLDYLGELISYTVLETPHVGLGHSSLYAGSMIKTSDNGFLIAASSFKDGFPVENIRYILYLVKLDPNGIFLSDTTIWENDYIYRPKSLISNSDGYIFCGTKGVSAQSATIMKTNYLCKLSDNLSIDWEIEYGGTCSTPSWIGMHDIYAISDSEYVSCGNELQDTLVRGLLLNFNIDGTINWDTYFEYIPYPGTSNIPEHCFYDVEQTMDGGFIMTGYAMDAQAIADGNPGQFSWLVKTDSNGCLVPGCQDFFNVEKYPEQVQLHIYPNPAADQLNVYYGDHNFTGKSEAQIYDLNGRLIHSWVLNSNDITYIYDVSYLDAGVYVIKVVEEGDVISTKKFVKE